jgi:alanine-synthesizing transaminase
MRLASSRNMTEVSYEIRGPLLDLANEYERDGVDVVKLNIGDPAAFGLTAPEALLDALAGRMPAAQPYTEARGRLAARTAVAGYYHGRGVPNLSPEAVYLGNGVSELVCMALQALLDPGDEVLVPAPDYPLWTGMVAVAGGRPVHYLCDESAGWQPDLADLEAKVSERTRAIVVINPNNPTGAVWPRAVLEQIANVAAVHGVLLMADEIYDAVVYDTEHVSLASIAPDLPCCTFSGLSKRARLPGVRAGWLALTGPRRDVADYASALDTLAMMRLCPNHVGQFAVELALSEGDGTADLVAPGGRLRRQRDCCLQLLNSLPGVSCAEPQGAFYVFPRLDPTTYPIEDDGVFALELLREAKILVVQGSGLGWPRHDHFRMVTLPPEAELTRIVGRLGEFLAAHRDGAPAGLARAH